MQVSGRRPPKWLQVSKAVAPEFYGCISEEMRKAGDEEVCCVHRIQQRVDWATRYVSKLHVACAGLMAALITVPLVPSSWPMGLLTTTVASVGSGMMGLAAWESCNQVRTQCSECYTAGKMLAIDMIHTSAKIMDFQLDCLVDTSSTQDA